jgi:hypothetical protein
MELLTWRCPFHTGSAKQAYNLGWTGGHPPSMRCDWPMEEPHRLVCQEPMVLVRRAAP